MFQLLSCLFIVISLYLQIEIDFMLCRSYNCYIEVERPSALFGGGQRNASIFLYLSAFMSSSSII